MTVTVLQPDAAAGKDCYIADYVATTNTGTSVALIVGDNGSAQDRALRVLIGFDIAGSIAAGEVIDAVELALWESSAGTLNGGLASRAVTLHRVLVDWVESQATWNRYKTNTDWHGSAGCSTDGTDRIGTASASLTMDGDDADDFVTWSGAGMVADVQGWLDGDFSNYGWLVLSEGESQGVAPTANNNFDSSDSADSSHFPKLTVTHHTPTGGAPIHLCRTHFIAEGILR